MKELIMSKAKGLMTPLDKFYSKVSDFELNDGSLSGFTDIVSFQMKELGFDMVTRDKAGNIIGVIKGYSDKEPLVMISHTDIITPSQQKLENMDGNGVVNFKAGIVSSLYAGALIKRSLLPLGGDLIICCVPRMGACDLGIRYLFDYYLKPRLKKIKGIILSEPTDFNVNLGHKGRMEYEIIVRGRLNRNFLEHRGINMLGAMFPLINELEKASKELPSDFNLGRSGLRIKDIRYGGHDTKDEQSEFRVVVDRVFIPEEAEEFILNKAKTIAKTVYKGEPEIMVNTILAKERVKTYTGLELLSKKEFKPWSMEGHHPFALNSLKGLTEGGIRSDFGFWKKIITEGSYTYGELKIPTVGFGAGSEDDITRTGASLSIDKLGRAMVGQALIVHRNIGFPTFGWSSDEI